MAHKTATASKARQGGNVSGKRLGVKAQEEVIEKLNELGVGQEPVGE